MSGLLQLGTTVDNLYLRFKDNILRKYKARAATSGENKKTDTRKRRRTSEFTKKSKKLSGAEMKWSFY